MKTLDETWLSWAAPESPLFTPMWYHLPGIPSTWDKRPSLLSPNSLSPSQAQLSGGAASSCFQRFLTQSSSASRSPFYFAFLAHQRAESLDYLEPTECSAWNSAQLSPGRTTQADWQAYNPGWEGLNSAVFKLWLHIELQCLGHFPAN